MIVDRALVTAALPGYELGEQVGQGTFGMVVAARDRLRRDVAVKILPGISYHRERAETEALNLAKLIHPHIVHVHDFMPAGDVALIVMELLAGGSLRSRLRQGRVAPEWACAVALAVADALESAHDEGLLHRDVKPENILFTADGRLKMTDFGIAKALAETGMTASTVIGTPRYMAPEQFMAGTLRRTVDVYALGVMTYEMLTGFAPSGGKVDTYETLRHFHLHTPPPPLGGVPKPIAEVVLRSLAKDPGVRQPTARTFALELAAATANAFGTGWLARAGIAVELDVNVRDACEPGFPDSTPTMPAIPAIPAIPATQDVPTDLTPPDPVPADLVPTSLVPTDLAMPPRPAPDAPPAPLDSTGSRSGSPASSAVPRHPTTSTPPVPVTDSRDPAVPDSSPQVLPARGPLGPGTARPSRPPSPAAAHGTADGGTPAAPPAGAERTPAGGGDGLVDINLGTDPEYRRRSRQSALTTIVGTSAHGTADGGTPAAPPAGAERTPAGGGDGLVDINLGTDPEYRRRSRQSALTTVVGTLLIVAMLGLAAFLLL